MRKALILILSSLAIFLILVGAFYYISVPVLHLSSFKGNPGAQQALNPMIWVIIIGAPAVLTAGFMRLMMDMLYGRRGRRRR